MKFEVSDNAEVADVEETCVFHISTITIRILSNP